MLGLDEEVEVVEILDNEPGRLTLVHGQQNLLHRGVTERVTL
jgi:hypothetical protein